MKEYELSRSFKPSIPRLSHKGYSVDTPASDQGYDISNDVILPTVSKPTSILTKSKSFSSSIKDKDSLINSIVDNYKKKYKKNRRGKKMGSRE